MNEITYVREWDTYSIEIYELSLLQITTSTTLSFYFRLLLLFCISDDLLVFIYLYVKNFFVVFAIYPTPVGSATLIFAIHISSSKSCNNGVRNTRTWPSYCKQREPTRPGVGYSTNLNG